MIEVENLSKHYGALRAVDDVSFVARPGRVTGFLGPNGAGKSTAMRAMVGLTRPTSGSTRILGARYAELRNPGRVVGLLLDAGAVHAGRTGRESLRVDASTLGLSASRVDEVLDLVGLTPSEAKRRVGGYSLGMKQRLGLARAFLGEPEVLVLDEPANGLDPQGIHWMRGRLRTFADRGGTVLLSSHLLHEVEVVADDIVVIGRGRIVAQGTKADLVGAGGALVRARDPRALADALAAAGLTARDEGGAVRVDATPEQVGVAAAAAGVVLLELREATGSGLEEAFLQLTTATDRTTDRSMDPTGAVA
ncbi:ATP-binding cassette domain-containing protein [Agilicoccus flavus]|uniref:ATP-binding cassette domain-containing protein n=1 Tax=Agilicoccus flavus TaxID=2775968 RepID=UPI001CF6E522|nr:ATP-binding cassette domain-containing protein [Agilicoccus flavus]